MASMIGMIRSVTGDLIDIAPGFVYPHEHLILDSPLIQHRFPLIWLNDEEAAVSEVRECATAGVALLVDAMPMSAGRDADRLVHVSSQVGVPIISATGLHHDRYYGPRHWTNRIPADALVDLFIADLLDGIDRFDYTGPIVDRSAARAGLVKIATSGEKLSPRDRRNLEAGAAASVATGAPILTHCEGGWGGLQQVESLTDLGVPSTSIILSHVDKTGDSNYLIDLAQSGVLLEFDRAIRQKMAGEPLESIVSIVALIAAGYEDHICVSNDGALREFWHAYGGAPGLAWLASTVPSLLTLAEVRPTAISKIMRENALRALRWRAIE